MSSGGSRLSGRSRPSRKSSSAGSTCSSSELSCQLRDAGIYAVVSRFVLVGALTQRAIIPLLGPRFSALFAVDDYRAAQTLYQTSTAWLVSLSFPFYLLVSAFASVVLLMFGREFEPGATPLAILSLAMLVNIATGPATTILLMGGKASGILPTRTGRSR